MKTFTYSVLAFALACTTATAQSVHKTGKASTQLILVRNEQGFQQCGIRYIASDATPEHTDFYDVNFTAMALDQGKVGLVDGGRLRVSQAQLDQYNGRLPKPSPGPSPVKFWITKSTDAKPLVPMGILPDKSGIGALHAVLPFEDTVTQIVNMAEGYSMQFLMQYPNQEARVIELTAPLEREDTRTLASCLADLVQRKTALKSSSAK